MVLINVNALDVPAYLRSEEFFLKVLGTLPSKIEEIEFSMGTSGGDNYCSIIYRVRLHYSIDGRSECTSVIVKCVPYDGEREVFKKINVFQKEIVMYSKVLPAMEKLLSSAEHVKQIAPKLLYSIEDPIDTLVFQDLSELQMTTSDRSIGLDEIHSCLVMQRMGQYHAASMKVARERPDLMDRFGESFFDKNGDCEMRRTVFAGNISDMADLVEGWHGFEDIAKKLRRIDGNFEELCNKCVEPREGEVRVLNHGDLWVNNCMFRYNRGTPIEMMLIDFQMCFYSSPALDLHYFLNTSVQLPVLITKRYQLLRTYYQAFASTLRRLRYFPIPTWEEIKREISSKEFYGFWAFEAILPLLSMDKDASKDNSIDSFSNAEEARKKRQIMFSSERFLNAIRHLLDRFDELGVLDV